MRNSITDTVSQNRLHIFRNYPQFHSDTFNWIQNFENQLIVWRKIQFRRPIRKCFRSAEDSIVLKTEGHSR